MSNGALPVDRYRKAHRKRSDVEWVRIGAFVLVVSLLLNVLALVALYSHNIVNFGTHSTDLSDADFVSISSLEGFAGDGMDLIHASESFHQGIRHLSSSSSSSSSPTAGSAHDGHHGPHQHDALLYLFNALLVGVFVMQLSAKFPILQQTVVLFVLGFMVSIFLEGFNLKDKMSVWGDSYEMWMDIDPHLLLFTLLPALLAGDAMTIDTSVARRVALQCLWLAGPGVCVGGFGCALFLWGYLGWDFYLCLCAGAILCATDPVAVVALLKELGASPMLTVQIQGESLLNDGTAIVLYLISYNVLRGEKYEWADVAEFLIKKAMMAWALGLFIGYFFFSWIRFASDRLDGHHSGMIQITLTLVCAYWSFMFVEGVLQLSGVLATVASSLVLAHHMWPYIVSKESMSHVWHTFESLGNIIIFFLAGSITGNIVVDIEFVDYLHLVVLYIFLTILRGCLIFASRPILKILSADKQPVSWQEAVVMTWGGLRGAVGLALAVSVKIDRAPHICDETQRAISEKDAERLLFFVSGIAFLTMVINAMTAPFLVRKLGITAMLQTRKQLLKMFHQQLVNWSEDSNNPKEVTQALMEMLHEAEEEIDHQQVAEGSKRSKSTVVGFDEGDYQKNNDLIAELETKRAHAIRLLNELYGEEEFEVAVNSLLGEEVFDRDDDSNTLQPAKVEDMILLLRDNQVDVGMAKVINQCFLELVFEDYLRLIKAGDLRPGSTESDVLLTSVRMSLCYVTDLKDYDYVHEKVCADSDIPDEEEDGEFAAFAASNSALGSESDARSVCLHNFVASWQFNVAVAVTILLNSVQVVCEEIWRDNCTEKCGVPCPTVDADSHAIWLVLDTFFTTFFFVEFAIKFATLWCRYFMDNWNRFDFFLVVVGIFGLTLSFISHGKEAELAGKTRIIRVARVLRTLRFLRIFRLFHARLSSDKFVSMALARHMKKIQALQCFIVGQLSAQWQMVKYFGGNGKLDDATESEIARCILQSQVNVYRALCEAAGTRRHLDNIGVSEELENLRKRKKITERLSEFVMDAHNKGALSATEAHAILHPLNHQVSTCMRELNNRQDGVLDRRQSQALQPGLLSGKYSGRVSGPITSGSLFHSGQYNSGALSKDVQEQKRKLEEHRSVQSRESTTSSIPCAVPENF